MIEVIEARKRYWRRSILQGASFTVEKGTVTCLIGLNGAGKSTLLKAIMGLTPLTSGRILVDGEPIGPAMYERVSFIPDHLTLPPSMKLWEGLRFMAEFYANWNAEKAAELMTFFRLSASDRIGNLSKGTAAKFNLVTGLALDTEYVLMDEPFSGIDMFSREMIADVFASDLIEGRGVLLTTHEIGEMEHLIDKAVLLSDGVVVREFNCEAMRVAEGKSVVDVMREAYRA
ncbi:ABC transporter ATP-binding protein [Paenibacillus methanolicus]|uniref:ABC-2 type transport system ATP-binding protein n=1 Tax=Paenibacillus methanolicus TaxID=582686 RepID=A0A5S5C298_9BACL|nr:ABC transporter ATP-binding protein [Paenibacillus methanolicus]TYP72460.1 ABC-2 type transport system ATP-binding protein [Paenibacillus methanolicus]